MTRQREVDAPGQLDRKTGTYEANVDDFRMADDSAEGPVRGTSNQGGVIRPVDICLITGLKPTCGE
jgi:hypothetical protein